MATNFPYPSAFANAVTGLRWKLNSTRLTVNAATTGAQAVSIVNEPGTIEDFRMQMVNVGASSSTTPCVVQLRKIPAGSITPVVLASLNYSGSCGDMVRKSPSSSTSQAALTVAAGDMIVLRNTASAVTTSGILGWAEVDVYRNV